MNLINDLEKYRIDNGLDKAEMARFFDVPSQNYNNWVYRNSLPKEHYERASKIINSGKSQTDLNAKPKGMNKDEKREQKAKRIINWVLDTEDEQYIDALLAQVEALEKLRGSQK